MLYYLQNELYISKYCTIYADFFLRVQEENVSAADCAEYFYPVLSGK